MAGVSVCTAAPGSDEWLAARPHGIGASEVPILLGLNPYQSPLDLWLTKTGQADAFVGNYATKRGHHLEPFVIAAWADANPGYIVETAPDDIPSMLAHPDHPEVRCSPDALVHSRHESAALEAKTANYRQRDKWADGAMPDAYAVQVQYQLLVTGLDVAYVAADIAGDFVQRVVPRNDALCEHLRITVTDWWWQHVAADGPRLTPPVDVVRDRDLLAKVWTPDVTLEPVVLPSDAVTRLRDAKAALNAAKTEWEVAAAEVQAQMQEAVAAVDANGDPVATWTASKGRASMDTALLKEELPLVAAKYMRTGKPGRRFSITAG